MLVSLKWLKDLVDVPASPDELADRFDLTGTAVEAVHSAGASLDGVVVGQVVEKQRHTDAEKLWVTTVDVGGPELLQIVCGAQNFDAGDKVPVALVGATLPNGMSIKKAKLRGVTSQGMNCSAAELGLGTDQSGLMILPADAPIGMPFAQYWGLSDTVFELEITPNRPDCLCVAGVAREVGAILGTDSRVPHSEPAEAGEPAGQSVNIEIADPALCPRYTARLIRGVKIGPSPDWLVERITSAGARPINNVVDVTNYVMFELGQPLHAFDADLLARDADGAITIGVRSARDGERLTTLDGQERELVGDTLLITDAQGPVALAGVMGGESTEVHDGTVNVLLESACFDAASVSRTSRRLGLISEASTRFEKILDRTGCAAASDRAAALITEIAGGEVAPGIVDAYPTPVDPVSLELRVARLNALLGTDIPAEDAARILGRLGCGVSGGPEVLSVEPPSFRPDLEREIDLVEEVLRVHGMERVASTLPAGRGRVGGLSREQQLRERVGTLLRAQGLNETMTYSFTSPADMGALRAPLAEGEVLPELLNPMSSEQSVMRHMLLPGLLRSFSYNQRRGNLDVALYELGAVFSATSGRKQPKEHATVGGALSGRWHAAAWNDAPSAPNSPDTLDFFDVKGIVEELADGLAIEGVRYRPAEIPWLQPGRAAEVVLGGEIVGWVGEVHPAVLTAFDAEPVVAAFELSLAPLMRSARDSRPYRDVPRFPAVELDIAVVVPDEVSAERLESALMSAGGKLLEEARLFDVYRGAGVDPGQKSMAFALTYRAPDRTLTAEEIEPQHERLLRKALAAVGGSLRE